MRIFARLLVLLPLLWVDGVWAEQCAEPFSNLTLTTQAEVDALGQTGCTYIYGSLIIQNSSDITNLDGLGNLTSVAFGLSIINNTALRNVDGLSSLTSISASISGGLTISDNPSLTSLKGLSRAMLGLRSDIRIVNNDSLIDLDGLARLSENPGALAITGNDSLKTLDGLNNSIELGFNTQQNAYAHALHIKNNKSLVDLDALGGARGQVSDLNIEGNDLLRNLDGLRGISAITGVGNAGWVRGLVIHNNGALSNIDGLSNLATVDGSVSIINNDALRNLDGLVSLTGIGQTLDIQDNDALTSISGLANITSVEGDLLIKNNEALTNLDGLANITSVGGDLQIVGARPNNSSDFYGNGALTNLDGLANITSVGGGLGIGYIGATNLNGLANITSVGGYLSVDSNEALTNLDGLSSLTSVGGDLDIIFNRALINLDGLTNITAVAGNLTIAGTVVTNLDGLASLTSVGGNLTVGSNPYLSNCQGVAQVLGWPNGPPDDNVEGDITLLDNATGCNSVAEILASVPSPTQPFITEATTSSNGISLAFTPSTTASTTFPITGYSASCKSLGTYVSSAPDREIPASAQFTETLAVSGFEAASATSAFEVDIDITWSDPTDLFITLSGPNPDQSIDLWSFGTTDTGGENLVGTFPTTLPTQPCYENAAGECVFDFDSIPSNSVNGDWELYISTVEPWLPAGTLNSWGLRIFDKFTGDGAISPIEVTGIKRGRDYTCTVAPVTKLGTTPVSNPYTVSVPLELPSVPTITSTDFEDGKIILTVSVSDNGGTDITGYEATCTGGTSTVISTSTSSPITVSGLNNDVAYTCTVTATNSVGTSSASAATAPITPEEQVGGGLPIWLLYQINQ